jgi:hypothetical protein
LLTERGGIVFADLDVLAKSRQTKIQPQHMVLDTANTNNLWCATKIFRIFLRVHQSYSLERRWFKMDKIERSKYSQIIGSINRPLGFFALALLIAETFLATVLIFSDLSENYKVYGMFTGAGMFFFVVIIVALLTWIAPKNLMYDQFGHLEEANITIGRISEYPPIEKK